MQKSPFDSAVSEHVWRTHYLLAEPGSVPEPGIESTWERVALAISGAEPHHQNDWRERFQAMLSDWRFLPGGRILAGAGTSHRVTLFNCLAMGPIEDSVQGIFNALRESMLCVQTGAAIGIDFSTLRPALGAARASGGIASGPVSFMGVWQAANAVLESGNRRRSAMLATMRCDHPDIEAFIDAKLDAGALSHFKLSVLLSDDFMQVLQDDGPWALVFPLGEHPIPVGGELCERVWSPGGLPQLCLVHRRVPARALWQKLLQAQHASAQPGVLFIDRINRANNLWYDEHLAVTSPDGAVPLPPWGACNLGSINLSRFVKQPFAEHPSVDFAGLRAVAAVATRFLDDVHDISLFPLKAQQKSALATRRIGLGVTGLADMLAMLGLRYGCAASVGLTREIMVAIRDVAYRTSVELAQEKGAFPACDKLKYGASPFVLDLDRTLQDAIAQHGIRNSHLLAVAPTESISLLAGNVSNGIEPMRAFKATRRVRGADGQAVFFEVQNAACRQSQAQHGPGAPWPKHFVQAFEVSAEDQLRLMAAVQSCVDGAVAKTVYLPEAASEQDVGLVLQQAWELGLKGCAVDRLGQLGPI
ncbi:MAG: adenosylcobalamin-dependent ribonucleoside-diphosphate reductase [Rhodoferax sp.]